MSGPLGSSQYMYSAGAGEFYSHLIEQSCRFDSGDSSRLYRTFTTHSDATKLTISFSINFALSYLMIFIIPLFIGLYQVIKIEND